MHPPESPAPRSHVRFIHTADWHLGKLFHGRHLTDDQSHVLEQLIDLVRRTRPDAVIVAGDLYDRAVPPPDAVRLLDHVLSEIVLGARVPVVIVAGNHDSPDRLAFGSRLLAGQGLHVFGVATAEAGRVGLRDEHGAVSVYAVPYAEPAAVRAALEDAGVNSHQTAMDGCVARIRMAHPAGERSVLVGHTFVTGGAESSSERPLAVGGVASVDAASFAGFDYVALGHLHRPQALAGGHVRYSGSVLKYSFDEASHRKGVHMVEIGADGAAAVEEIPLVPRHDVREVRGLLADLLRDPVGPVDDYLAFVLDDVGPIVDATGQLRAVYPNVLDQRKAVSQAPQRAPRSGGDYRTVREEEVFPRFFLDVTDVEISMPQLGAFTRTLERMRTEEREVVA